MKVTLSEINKNLQGINSRVNEAKNQINDLEDEEEKIFHQNSKEKNDQRKQGLTKEPLGHLQMCQHLNHRDARRRRGRART